MIFEKGDAVRLVVYIGEEPIVAKATYEFLEKSKNEGVGIPFADIQQEVVVDDIKFTALVQFRGEDRLMNGLSILEMRVRPKAKFTIEVIGVIE